MRIPFFAVAVLAGVTAAAVTPAGAGWDYVTGLGMPKVTQFLNAVAAP
ncbi:hypothetical protein [Amycolatopsis sp. H20-H5]|nr:hypothetical protein [Amycolatopsis sp. H20-H5]MEC3981189.1 hypothetical protein [Amycolatopsis sp. H20-H5]